MPENVVETTKPNRSASTAASGAARLRAQTLAEEAERRERQRKKASLGEAAQARELQEEQRRKQAELQKAVKQGQKELQTERETNEEESERTAEELRRAVLARDSGAKKAKKLDKDLDGLRGIGAVIVYITHFMA